MIESREPPLVFAPGAAESVLPIRYAAAVALRGVDERILLVRRNANMAEFPGVWSLPSAYQSPGTTALESLRAGLREWLDLEGADWHLRARRMALRPQWRLLMHLYEAKSSKVPALISSKYDRFRWIAADELLAKMSGEHVGDCMLAFKEYSERIAPARS